MQTTTSAGAAGEILAAKAMQNRGMRIVARNFRSLRGEIDLIVLDGEVLAFVEVKTWPAYGLENLAYGITEKKKQRIIETAKHFLATHREYNYRSIRFDVVFLRSGQSLVYLDSAFTESGSPYRESYGYGGRRVSLG
ncbi:MAG: YraN family protein [Treponema sp.]|jgi:putative endonuclease|nr:YraN family protein [Treponema sp.]